ncbi:MAG: hypothetical protein M3Z03_04900 [Actinomycetota bacterium]|nr:hypothetical protein [Actinomycetota bacterium]
MLRRSKDPDGLKRSRPLEPLDIAALVRQDRSSSEDPFEPARPAAQPDPNPLEGWEQITSFQKLDAPLVAELARASMSSSGVVVLQSGEVAVGAMLASLAIRGHDDFLQALIITGQAELRLHRYATGQLEPTNVHRMRSIADALRALAWCAATGKEGTFELVANDGRGGPVAIGASRLHELRWLQPPPASSPHDAPWAEITSQDPPPGADPRWWKAQLGKPLSKPASTTLPTFADVELPAPPPTITPSSFTGPGATEVVTRDDEPEPLLTKADAAELYDVVAVSVSKALSEALLELEIDAGAIEQLRENPTLDDTLAKVIEVEQILHHLGPLNRQIHELTTVIEDLHDTMRSIVRQQWESAPPQNYWNRSQRAADELQRSVDELASELRSRLPRSLAD